jgi:hypothetical protein
MSVIDSTQTFTLDSQYLIVASLRLTARLRLANPESLLSYTWWDSLRVRD